VALDELRRGEEPDVGVARLAQDLAQELEALGQGRGLQPEVDFAHRERRVPGEVGNDVGIGDIRAEEARACHDTESTPGGRAAPFWRLGSRSLPPLVRLGHLLQAPSARARRIAPH